MKQYRGYLLGALVVIVFAAYFWFSRSSDQAPSAIISNNTPTDTTGQGSPSSSNSAGQTGSGANTPGNGFSDGTNNTPSGANPTTPAPTPIAKSGFKDGTYTGTVADAVYGQIQVVATIQNGKLVNTTCPVFPNSGGHTSEVSQLALPQLKQEAIAAQGANINIVSGATQTSQAYQESLQAALDQAKA